MREYSYNARKDGNFYQGLEAGESPEIVIKKLERMGFKDILINDILQNKSHILAPIPISAAKPKEQDPKQPFNSEEDSRSIMNSMVNSMVSGLGNDVKNVGEEARKAKNIIQSKELLKEEHEEEVLIGDKAIVLSVNEKLKAGYKVKFPPNMRLDPQGKMQYLFVLERN